MVEIKNREHFDNAVRYARSIGGDARQSFRRCLSTINRIKRNYRADVSIFPDFVKHSFTWSIVSDGRQVLFGGMILHGFEETYSVELTPRYAGPHWSLHT